MTEEEGGWLVRGQTEAELDAVLDLAEAVAREGRWIAMEYPFDRDERRERFSQSLDDPRRESFVAVASDRVIGQAGVGWASDAVPATMGMMVAADWRGRGVGTALLTACVEWARDAGAFKLALDVWPHNDAAIALYRKHGFIEEGYRVKHYRRRNGELWDSVDMGLLL
ncbi:MAG TPA: GNAT family N-acetyltransferase [Actinomycetota bacterium]|jgi:putative acetyltransferase